MHHPTAIIEDGAKIGADVHIGPYCHIHSGANVEDGCRLDSHVILHAGARLAKNCHLHSFASVGDQPQHLRYDGRETLAVIGEGTTIRSHSTVHIGLEGNTVVGEGCFIMEMCHVGHDCQLGKSVVLTSQAMLGGHTEVGEGAILAAQCGVHQFVRIGKGAMIGGGGKIRHDVPPYTLAKGEDSKLRGLNFVGLKRSGHSRSEIKALKQLADRLLFQRVGPFQSCLEAELETTSERGELERNFLGFLESGLGRPVAQVYTRQDTINPESTKEDL